MTLCYLSVSPIRYMIDATIRLRTVELLLKININVYVSNCYLSVKLFCSISLSEELGCCCTGLTPWSLQLKKRKKEIMPDHVWSLWDFLICQELWIASTINLNMYLLVPRCSRKCGNPGSTIVMSIQYVNKDFWQQCPLSFHFAVNC